MAFINSYWCTATLLFVIFILLVLYLRSIKQKQPTITDIAVGIMVAERKRQIEVKGYDSERDDNYKKDELAIAAACYLYAPKYPFSIAAGDKAPDQWPMVHSWKPQGGRMRQLQKASGLLLAEMERQLRKEAHE